jgi:hypothetical protein
MDLGNNMGFDSVFQIDLGNYTNELYDSTGNPKTVLVNSPDAYTAISLGGRFFMNLSYTVKLTAWGFFDYKNEGFKDLTYNQEHKRVDTANNTSNSLLINIGTSFEIEAIKNKLIMTPLLGIIIYSNEMKSEVLNGQTEGSIVKNTNDGRSIPYLGFSFEYNIREWLTIYSGYTKLVNSPSITEYHYDKLNGNTQAEETNTLEKDTSNSSFSVGISLQNDIFKFTTTLNKDLMINGPNFISGTTAPMFLNATLEYKFGTPEKKLLPIPDTIKKDKKKKVEVKELNNNAKAETENTNIENMETPNKE